VVRLRSADEAAVSPVTRRTALRGGCGHAIPATTTAQPDRAGSPGRFFAGAWVAVLNWRLGPRLGAFNPHPSGTAPAAQNAGMATAGLLLILFALPLIALASGYVIPGPGFSASHSRRAAGGPR
jgi:hypothetical protein